MKHFLFMATMLLAFGAVNAQIADVTKKGDYLYVYDENGKKLSSMYLRTYDVTGITSSFFIVKLLYSLKYNICSVFFNYLIVRIIH